MSQFTYEELTALNLIVDVSEEHYPTSQAKDIKNKITSLLAQYKTLVVTKYMLDQLDQPPLVDKYHFVCDDLTDAMKQFTKPAFDPAGYIERGENWIKKFPECHIYYRLE